jgi:hypothetical protein
MPRKHKASLPALVFGEIVWYINDPFSRDTHVNIMSLHNELISPIETVIQSLDPEDAAANNQFISWLFSLLCYWGRKQFSEPISFEDPFFAACKRVWPKLTLKEAMERELFIDNRLATHNGCRVNGLLIGFTAV